MAGIIPQTSGLFPSAGSGRADTMKATVPAGTYIIPADIVSALGDGNTIAGAKVLDHKFGQDSSAGPGPVAAPPMMQPPPPPPQAGLAPPQGGFARGGMIKPAGAPVPILASGGEYRVLPQAVAALGGGDMQHGHDILDSLVSQVRKKYASKLKKLPSPRSAKKK